MTLPLACDLSPDSIRSGRARLLPGLADDAISRDETETGYRLTFPASSVTLQRVIAVVDAERQCCRWLHFELTIPPDRGPFTLTLSGPAGAREFLAALFETPS